MKGFVLDFARRGAMAAGIGPVVLAVIYLILQQSGGMETVTVNQACIGIFSLTALAFVAGGMNAIYQIERLPLMVAVLIHGCVLYISYLITYLLNDWLEAGIIPLVVFSLIFVVGYIVIWAIIYFITKRSTANLNKILQQKQKEAEE